ncbi:MAG: type III pantothenate kinase [Bacteroidota bacterium]|nr:type III pantothenate kinase [Bacteroidota bacterium]
MNLIIDIGNTRIKAALFENAELKHFFVYESSNALIEADLFETYPIKHCIVASVVNNVESFIDQLKERTQTQVFTSQMPVPLINLYQSANTLGSDRLAAAVGSASLFPGKNVVVIDAGTCVKYNFVNSNNEFIGGAISPGLKMRFKALNTFTSKLPLLGVNEKFDTLIGTTTAESILSGVEIGIIAEVEGLIDSYKQLFPDINVVLTGGDANFFEKRLKRRIFADSFLILKGLNCILDHNLKK